MKSRKLFGLLMTLLIGLCVLNLYHIKASDDNKITLNIGDTYQLTYEGTYGSTNNEIASVDKIGLITANSIGNCEIVVIDNEFNAITTNITVVYEDSIYIEEDGLEYQNPVIYIEGIKVELNTTKVKDLYLALLETKKYSIKSDEYITHSIMSKLDQVFNTTLTLYIYDRSTDIVKYKLYIRPNKTNMYVDTALKDMIVVGINPTYQDYKLYNDRDQYIIDDYYWFTKSFSVSTTSGYVDFYDDIRTKFSGYTEDNIQTEYNSSYWRVAIKLKNMPDNYYDGYREVTVNNKYTYYLVFDYIYDILENKCKAIGCYITPNVTKKLGIGSGYCSYSMY